MGVLDYICYQLARQYRRGGSFAPVGSAAALVAFLEVCIVLDAYTLALLVSGKSPKCIPEVYSLVGIAIVAVVFILLNWYRYNRKSSPLTFEHLDSIWGKEKPSTRIFRGTLICIGYLIAVGIPLGYGIVVHNYMGK